jgi:F-type H+-transporting ATPase subunit b
MNIELSQIISQIIAFLIMLWVLKRYAWGPLLQLLDERRDKIKGEFDAIEKEKRDVDTLRKSYEEKWKAIDTAAKTEGQKELEKARLAAKEFEESAHRRAHVIIRQATETAEHEATKAMAGLKDNLIQLTMAATEAVLRKSLDTDHQKQVIAECIEEVKIK